MVTSPRGAAAPNHRAIANPRRTLPAPTNNGVRQNIVRAPNSAISAVASGAQILARAQGPPPSFSASAASGSDRQARIQQAVNTRNQFWNNGMITNMASSPRPTLPPRSTPSATDRDRYLASALQYSFDNYDDEDDDDDDDIDVSSISFRVQNSFNLTGRRYDGYGPVMMNPYDQLTYETPGTAEQARTQNQRADTTEGAVGGAGVNEPKPGDTGKEPQPKEVKPEPEPEEELPPTFRWVHIEIVDGPNYNNQS
ncbi:unnamed protein product [Orchesella dallaii]|uniref:Uncharacterized protein n=1 Tax=Orchesella dallaii TaxID=48710 RepID=A0ABP1RDI9_9HEXA